jgi:hypothetical protein
LPWVFNHAFVPALVVLGAIVVFWFFTRRFVLLAMIAGTVAVGLAIYYVVGNPGWHVGEFPAGLRSVLFGLSAITYAKHPEGILEFNKRQSLARTQRWIDKWKARRGGPDATATPSEVTSPVGAAVGAPR